MKLSLLVACILGVTLFVPHHMISAIYVPPEMMPAGAPVEGSNNADAQTRSLGGAARGSDKQGVPQPSGRTEVNPSFVNLPDAAAAAPVAAADAVVIVPAVPAVPAVPVILTNPDGPHVSVVVPFADDDDDDDDD